MALVETRRRTLRPSASEMKVTLQRLGKNLRLVLMLEWLTLWPVWGALAVSSQRRDMVLKSSKLALARQRRRRRGSISGPFRNGRTYRQRGPPRQGWRGRRGARKNRDFFKRNNHIKGAFAADIMARARMSGEGPQGRPA